MKDLRQRSRIKTNLIDYGFSLTAYDNPEASIFLKNQFSVPGLWEVLDEPTSNCWIGVKVYSQNDREKIKSWFQSIELFKDDLDSSVVPYLSNSSIEQIINRNLHRLGKTEVNLLKSFA